MIGGGEGGGIENNISFTFSLLRIKWKERKLI